MIGRAITNHKRRLWVWYWYGVVVMVLFIIGLIIGLDEVNNCGNPISIRHWIPAYSTELLVFWVVVFPLVMKYRHTRYKRACLVMVLIHFIFVLGWTIFGTISFARDSEACHTGDGTERFWVLVLSYLIVGYIHLIGLLYLIITGIMGIVVNGCIKESYRVVH